MGLVTVINDNFTPVQNEYKWYFDTDNVPPLVTSLYEENVHKAANLVKQGIHFGNNTKVYVINYSPTFVSKLVLQYVSNSSRKDLDDCFEKLDNIVKLKLKLVTEDDNNVRNVYKVKKSYFVDCFLTDRRFQ